MSKQKYLNLKQNGGGTLHIINNRDSEKNETLENVDDYLIKNIPNVDTSIVQPYRITRNGSTYNISKNNIPYNENYKFELKIEPKVSLETYESPVVPPVVSHVVPPVVPRVVSHVVPPVVSRVVSHVVPRVASPVASRVASYGNPHTHEHRIEIIGSNYNPSDLANTDFTQMIK